MADNRDQTDDSTINENYIGRKRSRDEGKRSQVTSVGHTSNVINVGVSTNARDFAGAVYVQGNINKLKIQTIDRYRRRERQRIRQSLSVTDAEREARREEHDQDWKERQKRQREANEARWEERSKREGRTLSREEHILKDEEERRIKEERMKTRRLTSFFQPVATGSQSVGTNTSEALDTEINISQGNIVDGGDAVDETRAVEESGIEQESSFKEGMEVFLRLAFLEKEVVDSSRVKDAQKKMKKGGIIGKVIIEEVVGNVAKLNMDEFQKLSYEGVRVAGKGVSKSKFKRLKQALIGTEGKVNTKYLIKQNRKFGQNHKWEEYEIEEIRKAVEDAKIHSPKTLYATAAARLRNKYHGDILGEITKDQVRNVYILKVEGRNNPRCKVGRPRLLSHQCIEDLKTFATKTVQCKYSRPVYYYMYHFRKIIQKHGEAEIFANKCGNPRDYLRRFIKSARGSRRKVTKQGAKRLSTKQMKTFVDTMILRLAYLVEHYDLKKEDVFNFDETALRYHEDSDGMVIAPAGAKHVLRYQSDERMCPKQCLTFIPMVSCAGEKLDPAMIFKGTSGLTRSIPGYKDGFTKWHELYAEGKICFMQNKGKWTTNSTMTEWFLNHIIPRIKKDKQRRRDEGQQVSPKYVIILDGVSTHCFSKKADIESWITAVQREDKDLILLWLPPNTTGDLQPLDVNFNRSLKVNYRDQLYKIRLLSGSDNGCSEDELDESDDGEGNIVTTEDGIEFHLDTGNVGGKTRGQAKATRQSEAAYEVKSRVIEAIIHSYKSISKDEVKTAWRTSGKNVIEEFRRGTAFERMSDSWSGYNQAWNSSLRRTALEIQENQRKLFFKGMSGGISDIELGLQFIPMAGRKKMLTQEGTQDQVMDEAQTTSCSMQISEYASNECPDGEEDDSDDSSDDDEIVEALDELALDEETGQNSPESLN